MAETNGHAPAAAPEAEPQATAADVDALLAGLFEPTSYEIAPGRFVEIRPLRVAGADRLYEGLMKTPGEMQNFLLERCVFLNGLRLGAAGVARLPYKLAADVASAVMKVNGMQQEPADGETGDGEAADPKA